MQKVHDVVSQEEPSAQPQRELYYLTDEERHALLTEAGVVSKIEAKEALAIKAGMGMPWAKLRLLRR